MASRPSWDCQQAAEDWRRGAARRLATWAEAHELMLERARVESGMRVLDLGAGTGDQTFPLARRVGPTGAVLATDISAGMLGVLRADAAAAGVANIKTLVADASTA